MRRVHLVLAITALLFTAAGNVGCWAVHNRESDVDRTPIVNTGAGASVIYPGQSAPLHPGNYHPREAGYGQQGAAPAPQAGGAPPYGAPPQSPPPPATGAAAHLPPGAVASGVAQPPPEYASRTSSGSGSGAPRGSHITMIGGAETDETRHVRISEEPMWMKYLGLPFAVIAAPFKYGADKVAGDPEPAPDLPRLEDQKRPTVRNSPPVTDYETTQLQNIERELAQRQQPQAGAPRPPGYPAPAMPGAAPAATHGSFADELAALRQRHQPATPSAPVSAAPSAAPRAPVVARAPAPRPTATPDSGATPPHNASGEVDRDGDGRTDHWIERENGAIVREHFDEDFDSRPDRTLVYDPALREVVLIEEDSDFDGRTDSWTAFRGGRVTGRRVDGDGDGHVDTWSYYHDGTITRLERDATGDGFRDHIAYYRDGRLAREERDDDGDGRTDLVKYFDDGERVERVEEDADGDGEMDVVSHYEDGRLKSRQVLDASVLGLGRPSGSEVN